MKNIRRIFGNIDNKEKKKLIENALAYKMDFGYFNHDLYEESEEYSRIKLLVNPMNLQDEIVGSEFTKQEVEQSEVLIFHGLWLSGYPEPQDPILYQSNTYFDSCPECGIHGEQKAPFQFKSPKLGRNKLMGLNWVFDEIFVEREFYKGFFKKFEIEKREAVLYRKGQPVESVVQLDIPTADFILPMKNIEFSACLICKRVKYTPVFSDFFPSPPSKDFHIKKTQESFGSGHAAHKRIMVSNEMMQEMIKNRVAKHFHFVPCQ